MAEDSTHNLVDSPLNKLWKIKVYSDTTQLKLKYIAHKALQFPTTSLNSLSVPSSPQLLSPLSPYPSLEEFHIITNTESHHPAS